MMLQFIREKSQGWIAWAIIIAICIPFALWGVKSYLYNQSREGVVAVVNGTKILKRQVELTYHQLKLQQTNQQKATDDNYLLALKQLALQSIISAILLAQDAERSGFRVASELVEATLAKMPIFQVNGVFSSTRFEEILNRMLFTTEQFFDQVRSKILTNQLRSGVMFTSFALPYELQQFEKLMNQRRSFRYLIVPYERFLSDVMVSPKEVSDYYQAHLKEFETPEKVSIDYILLSLKDLVQTIHPTDEQIKNYYQSNLPAFSSPKKWKIQNIFIALPPQATKAQESEAQKTLQVITQKIKAGVSFSSLIQQYSQDKSSAVETEKDIPWVASSQLAPILGDVIVKMKKGDISTPIKLSNGYQMIKVIDIQPMKVYSFETVRNRLITTYQQQKAEQLYADLSEKLANITYESPNSLVPASQKLGLKINSTPVFSQAGGSEGITQDPRVIKAAFSEDVLNQDNNSELINLDDNRAIVIHRKLRIKPTVTPLDQVRGMMTKKVTTQKAKQKAAEVGRSLLMLLRQNQPMEKLLTQYHLKWEVRNDCKIHEKNINSEILSQVFRLPKPTINNHVNSGFNRGQGDYVIVDLFKGSEPDASQTNHFTETQTQTFLAGMANDFGMLEYSAYFQNLMAKAKIKYYKNVDDRSADDTAE